MFVTVLRHEPPPIVGMCGTIHDRAFMAFEGVLDWLESTGVLLERFDPSTARDEVARRPAIRQAIVADGDRALPLVAVDDVVVSRGVPLSRSQLARLVGAHRRTMAAARRGAVAHAATPSAA